MTMIEHTPNKEIFDLAIDAHFTSHITTEEYICYREAYGPDFAAFVDRVADRHREQRIAEAPWYMRWFIRHWT